MGTPDLKPTVCAECDVAFLSLSDEGFPSVYLVTLIKTMNWVWDIFSMNTCKYTVQAVFEVCGWPPVTTFYQSYLAVMLSHLTSAPPIIQPEYRNNTY